MITCLSGRVRRALLVLGISAGACVLHPRPAGAQWAVVCTNCSTIWNQLLSYAKEVQSVATQLQQYQTQLQQYANMVQNTAALPMSAWNMAQSDIVQVRNLMNVSQMLNGQGGTIMGRLNSLSGYSSRLNNLTTMPNQFQTWSKIASNDYERITKALGMQESEMTSDTALLATLQRHSQSATGQMQAIQAGNEMAALTASMLQKQMVAIQNGQQLMADRMAVDADRQALADAAMTQFLSPAPLPTSGNPRY